MLKHRKLVALLVAVALSQTACYTSYFISKDELRKLESSVEQKESVVVYGDCPGAEDDSPATPAATPKEESGDAVAYADLRGYLYAQGEEVAEVEEAVASDGSEAVVAVSEEVVDQTPPGCTAVDVSTSNTVYVVLKNGDELNVTPFNFIMSERQIVSPEYDMLENLSDVKGGEVSQFSTWKTVGLIVGVTAAAVGTFVGVSLLAGSSSGFGAN